MQSSLCFDSMDFTIDNLLFINILILFDFLLNFFEQIRINNPLTSSIIGQLFQIYNLSHLLVVSLRNLSYLVLQFGNHLISFYLISLFLFFLSGLILQHFPFQNWNQRLRHMQCKFCFISKLWIKWNFQDNQSNAFLQIAKWAPSLLSYFLWYVSRIHRVNDSFLINSFISGYFRIAKF